MTGQDYDDGYVQLAPHFAPWRARYELDGNSLPARRSIVVEPVLGAASKPGVAHLPNPDLPAGCPYYH